MVRWWWCWVFTFFTLQGATPSPVIYYKHILLAAPEMRCHIQKKILQYTLQKKWAIYIHIQEAPMQPPSKSTAISSYILAELLSGGTGKNPPNQVGPFSWMP